MKLNTIFSMIISFMGIIFVAFILINVCYQLYWPGPWGCLVSRSCPATSRHTNVQPWPHLPGLQGHACTASSLQADGTTAWYRRAPQRNAPEQKSMTSRDKEAWVTGTWRHESQGHIGIHHRDSTWQYLTASDSTLQYQTVQDSSWQFVTVPDSSWHDLTVPDST